MCRHLAYLGPPAPLSALVFDAPHALERQAWAPREMRGTATVNADGVGVGWFPSGAQAPLCYRRAGPIWADPGLPELARATSAGALVAAVRSASPGMPVGEAACAPFTGGTGEGGWLFSLNGRVEDWPESVAPLARELPVTALLRMAAPVDALLLWALVRHRLATGADPAGAVASVTTEVAAAARGSRLNLLLCDGRQIVATAAGHSLWVRAAGGAVVVASEPTDPHPAWQPVAEDTLLVATPSYVDIKPL